MRWQQTPSPVASPEAREVLVVLDDPTLLRGLGDLRWRLDHLLVGHPPVLVVDISALSRLSSATLAALLWAHRTCRRRGGRVLLRGPNKRCHDLLTRTGLLDLFAVDGVDDGADVSPQRARQHEEQMR